MSCTVQDLPDLPSGRYQVQHILVDDRGSGPSRCCHWTNSRQLYSEFHRTPPMPRKLNWVTRTFGMPIREAYAVHGWGQVDIVLAPNRRFVVHAMYDGQLPFQDEPRVFLSLRGLLSIGCLFAVDARDNWIVMRDGRLLMFASQNNRIDARRRYVLGPPAGDGPVEDVVQRPRVGPSDLYAGAVMHAALPAPPSVSPSIATTIPDMSASASRQADAAGNEDDDVRSTEAREEPRSANLEHAARNHWANFDYRGPPSHQEDDG